MSVGDVFTLLLPSLTFLGGYLAGHQSARSKWEPLFDAAIVEARKAVALAKEARIDGA